mgnify:FL=1
MDTSLCIGDMVRLTKGALWAVPSQVANFWRCWPNNSSEFYYGCDNADYPAVVIRHGAVLIITKIVWTGSDLYLLVAQPLDLIDLGWFQDYNFQLI